MPTPSPTITAMVVANSGPCVTLEMIVTNPRPLPTPATARPIGKPHRQDGARGQDQDHDGEGDADDLGLGWLESGQLGATDLDAEAVDVGSQFRQGLTDGPRLLIVDGLVEDHLGVSDRPVRTQPATSSLVGVEHASPRRGRRPR